MPFASYLLIYNLLQNLIFSKLPNNSFYLKLGCSDVTKLNMTKNPNKSPSNIHRMYQIDVKEGMQKVVHNTAIFGLFKIFNIISKMGDGQFFVLSQWQVKKPNLILIYFSNWL